MKVKLEKALPKMIDNIQLSWFGHAFKTAEERKALEMRVE